MTRDAMLRRLRGARAGPGTWSSSAAARRAPASPSTPRPAATTCCSLEQHDFGKGTSSRSTKLVHGGVRYLEQGNISLVMEALKERGTAAAERPAPGAATWPSSSPTTTGGRRRSTASASSSTTRSPGKYGFGSRAEILDTRRDARAAADDQDRGPARRRRLLRRPVRRRAAADQPGRRPRPSRARRSSTTCASSRSTKGADGFVDGVVAGRSGDRAAVDDRGARVVVNATGAVLRRACAGWPNPTSRR